MCASVARACAKHTGGVSARTRGVWRPTLRIKREVDAVRRRLNQADDVLVISVRDGCPSHRFVLVDELLASEYSLQEELL